MMKGIAYVLCYWLWSFSPGAHAADTAPDSLPGQIMYDSSAVTIRQFDRVALDAIRVDPDFQYEEQGPDLSWWKRFKQWLGYKWQEMFTREGSLSLLNGTLIVLGVTALCYLILKLLGMDAAGLFSRKAGKTPLDFMEQAESIHDIDFAQALQRAIDTGNYRLGVRLLYLDCLKKLSDFNLIDWKPAKTNATYIDELTDTGIQVAFRRLTRRFEYIWYGDFGITQQDFVQLREAFRQFDDRLK